MMKKLLVLFALLFSASMLVQAEPGQSSPPQNPIPATQQVPTKTDADKMGNGSGDDIDTVDEGDPAHDNEQEKCRS
jgi:hypothetical protein